MRAEAAEHEGQGRLVAALACSTKAEWLRDRAARRDIARLCPRLRDMSSDDTERRRLRRRTFRKYRELAEVGALQTLQALQALAELDSANAHEWQLRAARARSTKAMRAVARVHLDEGTEQDHRTALFWLRCAGEAGSTAAVLDGAEALERRSDYREAMDWHRWAGRNGDDRAAREMARLEAEHPAVALWRRAFGRVRRSLGS